MKPLLLTAAAFAAAALPAAEWSGFRNGGPSHASGPLPLAWSPGENIRWQTETAGYGQSAPVIAGGRVYLTAVDGDRKETALLLCHDLRTGEPVWERRFDTSERSVNNYTNARAAPTPAVDDDRVYAFWESGDLRAFTLDGEPLWDRSLTDEFGGVQNHHGLGGSPAQDGRALYLNVEHDGPSYLIAVDKATGETLWKVDRPSGKSWTTPALAQAGGRRLVVVSSAGHVAGYDAADGAELWRVEGLTGNTTPSPTAVPDPAGGPDRILVGSRIPEFGGESDAAAGNTLLELSADGSTATAVWQADRAVCHYASPVAAAGHAYFLSRPGVLAAVSLADGEVAYRKRLGVSCWATPVVSGERLYFVGGDGSAAVVKAGPEFAVLSESRLWPEDEPPLPESYAEAESGGHGHGGHGGGHGHGKSKSGGESGGPPGGFAARLLRGDADGDGRLSAEEMPETMAPMFAKLDTDGSGRIDAAELAEMERRFREKRTSSRSESRDPIVYGLAAADGVLVLRTGTRLFAVGVDERQAATGEQGTSVP